MGKTRTTPNVATIATGVASRGDVTQPTPNADGNFTVQPMQKAVADADYGPEAETPAPALDAAALTEIKANGRRMVRGPIAVANARSEQLDVKDKHLRALDLYEKARADYRDLKIAEHECVRQRDTAIAIRCEKMVGSDDETREAKKDGAFYKHTKTSVEAWAYEHDVDVRRLQRERDQITVSIFHAEAALDMAERALAASGRLLERNNAGTIANAQHALAEQLRDLPKRLIEAAPFLVAELRARGALG